MVINGNFWYPKDRNDPADWAAAERGMEFESGWFYNPIFGTGDYPQIMRETIDRKSKEAGLNESRLPHFTGEEIQLIKGKWFCLFCCWVFFKLNSYWQHI